MHLNLEAASFFHQNEPSKIYSCYHILIYIKNIFLLELPTEQLSETTIFNFFHIQMDFDRFLRRIFKMMLSCLVLFNFCSVFENTNRLDPLK